MSVRSITYSCDSCDQRVNSSLLWGDYHYACDGHRVHLKRMFGWCESCRSVTAIEDFSDEAQLRAEISEAESELEKLDSFGKRLLRSFIGVGRSDLRYQETRRLELNLRLDIVLRRANDERCLSCGSHDVGRLQLETRLVYDPMKGVNQGEEPTGCIHPSCGGEFIAQADFLRIHIWIPTRLYSPDGDLIEESFSV